MTHKEGHDLSTLFVSLRDIPNVWKPVSLQFQGPAFFLGILRVGNYPKDTFVKLEVSDISPLPVCPPNLPSQKNLLKKLLGAWALPCIRNSGLPGTLATLQSLTFPVDEDAGWKINKWDRLMFSSMDSYRMVNIVTMIHSSLDIIQDVETLTTQPVVGMS